MFADYQSVVPWITMFPLPRPRDLQSLSETSWKIITDSLQHQMTVTRTKNGMLGWNEDLYHVLYRLRSQGPYRKEVLRLLIICWSRFPALVVRFIYQLVYSLEIEGKDLSACGCWRDLADLMNLVGHDHEMVRVIIIPLWVFQLHEDWKGRRGVVDRDGGGRGISWAAQDLPRPTFDYLLQNQWKTQTGSDADVFEIISQIKVLLSKKEDDMCLRARKQLDGSSTSPAIYIKNSQFRIPPLWFAMRVVQKKNPIPSMERIFWKDWRNGNRTKLLKMSQTKIVLLDTTNVEWLTWLAILDPQRVLTLETMPQWLKPPMSSAIRNDSIHGRITHWHDLIESCSEKPTQSVFLPAWSWITGAIHGWKTGTTEYSLIILSSCSDWKKYMSCDLIITQPWEENKCISVINIIKT